MYDIVKATVERAEDRDNVTARLVRGGRETSIDFMGKPFEQIFFIEKIATHTIFSDKRKHATKSFTQCTMDGEIGLVCITKIDAACGVDNGRMNGATRESATIEFSI